MTIGWDSMSISASGLTANRLNMDIIANNIANANTSRTPEGGPYRREISVFTPMAMSQSSFSNLVNSLANGANQGGELLGSTPTGVQVSGIVQDMSPFKVVYDPSNPDAVKGYVQMPNVDVSQEMVDMISASRAYEANVTSFDAAKQMNLDALAIGK